MSTRAGEILREAAEAVDGPRNASHGDKERSFECIAQFWQVYLDHRHKTGMLDGGDVAALMVLLKLGRSLYGEPITDHFMDMAGYAAIAGELAEVEVADCDPGDCTDPSAEWSAIFGDPEAAKALTAVYEPAPPFNGKGNWEG